MKAIKGKKLFNGEKLIRNFCLAFDGGSIVYCGPESDMPTLAGEDIQDIGDAVIVPGLVDAHVHITGGYAGNLTTCDRMLELSARGTAHLCGLLEQGIVWIRDAGSAGNTAYVLRQLVEEGVIAGPHMKIAGPPLCITGGHGAQEGLACDGADEFAKRTRELIYRGSDWIKVMATATGNRKGPEFCVWETETEELEAVVREAHKKGVPVFVHAQGHGGLRRSIDAGVDCIEHGIFLDESMLAEMREKGIWFVPTLTPPHYGEQKLKEQGIEPPQVPGMLDENGQDRHDAIVLKAMKMGVKMACGTDAGCDSEDDFYHTYKELKFMGDIGIAPLDILTMASKNGAELLGVDDKYGTLEKGKTASFIIFEKDPTESIYNVDSPRTVFINGRQFYSNR